MNDIKKLRRLMRAAHAMQKSNPVILRGVPITQSKTDGSIREATGTLNLELIPEEHRPKSDGSTAKEPAPGVFAYYDLEKKSWRSFRCDNFIGFITQV